MDTPAVLRTAAVGCTRVRSASIARKRSKRLGRRMDTYSLCPQVRRPAWALEFVHPVDNRLSGLWRRRFNHTV